MAMQPSWDDRGLVPAVVQDATTGVVLMMAWMNAEALERTRDTGWLHFWSRSRRALWRKGETSGFGLELVELRLDCDGDTILARAHPRGPACHTGATTCFFTRDDGHTDDGVPGAAPVARPALAPLAELEHTMVARRDHATGSTSYTRRLLDGGAPAICAKIVEEQAELCAELTGDGPDARVVAEAADLLFHTLAGLVHRHIPLAAVMAELDRRAGVSGLAEKAARPPRDA